MSRIAAAIEADEIPEASLLTIKTRAEEAATALPAASSGLGVANEPPVPPLADVQALADKLWTFWHGVAGAALHARKPRLQPTWRSVMQFINFILGPEVVRRPPPPPLHLVIAAEQQLRQQWNRTLRSDPELQIDTLLANPQKEISHWSSLVFIPQAQLQARSAASSSGLGQAQPVDTVRNPKGAGKGAKARGPKRHTRVGDGKGAKGAPICFAFNSHKGCSEPCPRQMAHVCTRCKGAHPAMDPSCSARR